MTTVAGKACRKCGSTNRYSSTGKCVDCKRAYMRQRSKDKALDINAKSRAWRAANREHVARANKAWRAANVDRCRALTADWRRNNAQRMIEQRREYYQRNKTAIIARTQEHHHYRRANRVGHYTRLDLQDIWVKQGGLCVGCGSRFLWSLGEDKYVKCTIDHIIPVSRGGTNWPSNLQLLCSPCNDSKGAKLMEEWHDRPDGAIASERISSRGFRDWAYQQVSAFLERCPDFHASGLANVC